MAYLLSFEDGSSTYLEHHGVKGMKWGVQKERDASSMSKRQLKRAIKSSRKTYAKEHRDAPRSERRELGEHSAAVAKQHRKALKNDTELKKLEASHEIAQKAASKIQNKRMLAEDHLKRLEKDDSVSRISPMYTKARDNYQNYDKLYAKALTKANKLSDSIDERHKIHADHFYEKYKNAAVKDLGFKDIEAGKKRLNEYGLTRKAIGGSRFREGKRYV